MYKTRDQLEMHVDEDGCITYGDNDTEHLLSSEANWKWLEESIGQFVPEPKPKVITITITAPAGSILEVID